MSTQEIIAELPRLTRSELETVQARVHDLLRPPADGRPPTVDRPPPTARPWGEALLELAGTAQGLPEDFAEHHDHYLHGAPKP